eukprot:COSAG02_NODE_1090_length_14647_cov_122.569425_12_plen_205_part_00
MGTPRIIQNPVTAPTHKLVLIVQILNIRILEFDWVAGAFDFLCKSQLEFQESPLCDEGTSCRPFFIVILGRNVFPMATSARLRVLSAISVKVEFSSRSLVRVEMVFNRPRRLRARHLRISTPFIPISCTFTSRSTLIRGGTEAPGYFSFKLFSNLNWKTIPFCCAPLLVLHSESIRGYPIKIDSPCNWLIRRFCRCFSRGIHPA